MLPDAVFALQRLKTQMTTDDGQKRHFSPNYFMKEQASKPVTVNTGKWHLPFFKENCALIVQDIYLISLVANLLKI